MHLCFPAKASAMEADAGYIWSQSEFDWHEQLLTQTVYLEKT